MKTYALSLILALSLTSTYSFAGTDYVSTSLFLTEALQQFSPTIKVETIDFSEDLSEVSQLRQNNFTAKATIQNSLETPFTTYHIKFETMGSQVSCLGSIFAIDHAIMRTDQGKEFQDRSGMVYLSECVVSQSEISESFPPNFEIKYYVAFPKVESLPITSGTNLEKYKLYKSVVIEDKLFQCVNSDLNSMGVPRSSISVYKLEKHYAVGIQIGSSSTDMETNDIPVDVGEVDLGSIPWTQDNINFLKDLGPPGGSTFNIFFKKEDCKILGPENAVTVMNCRVDIVDPTQQTKKIKKVVFNFETQMVTKPKYDPKAENELSFENTLHFNANIEFTVDEPNKYHPIFDNTIYRNTLKYRRDSVKGEECHFASENKKDLTPANFGASHANFEI